MVIRLESASTKKYSANYQYYLCRNRLAYIREYVKKKHGVFIRTKLISMLESIFCESFKLKLGNLGAKGRPTYLMFSFTSFAFIILIMKHTISK